MRSSTDYTGPKAGRISVEAATKAATVQSNIEEIREAWDIFRSADTVRLSVWHKPPSPYDTDIVQASESIPISAVATILQQRFEHQISS